MMNEVTGMPGVHTVRDLRRQGRRRDEAGFTIIELGVAVMLLGLVSFVLFSFLDSATSVTNRASNDLQAEQKMTLALRTVTQEVRSASSLSQCSGAVSYKTCLVLTVPRSETLGLDCPARTMTYQLVSGTVRETRATYPANACSPITTTYADRPVLEKVVNTSAQPLFTYYDSVGATFDPDVQPAKVADAGSIKVEVKVDYGIKNAPVISLSSIAALRNQR